jgi:hypothetical protein
MWLRVPNFDELDTNQLMEIAVTNQNHTCNKFSPYYIKVMHAKSHLNIYVYSHVLSKKVPFVLYGCESDISR